VIFRLLNFNHLQGCILPEKARKALQSIIGQYSDIEMFYVWIAVASLNDASQAYRLETDAHERYLCDGVSWVSAQGLTDVLASLRSEVVSIELQIGYVLAVLFFKNWGEVESW